MFFFISSPYPRAPSADRHETLPHDRKLAEFYSAGPKIRVGGAPPPPKKKMGLKRAKFRSILYNLRL